MYHTLLNCQNYFEAVYKKANCKIIAKCEIVKIPSVTKKKNENSIIKKIYKKDKII